MPEVIFAGPDGRLEGRYHPDPAPDAPIALVLHPHPKYGGSMNNRVTYALHYAFRDLGFTVMRFNFRGVGRSQGCFDQGVGELSDAAAALDYLQFQKPNARGCWVCAIAPMAHARRQPRRSRSAVPSPPRPARVADAPLCCGSL